MREWKIKKLLTNDEGSWVIFYKGEPIWGYSAITGQRIPFMAPSIAFAMDFICDTIRRKALGVP